MNKLHLKWLALLGSLALGAATAAFAQDNGPLLDLLVKKGTITDQEAEDLRAALQKDFATNSAAGKLNLSGPLTEFRIAGDVRFRYEARKGELPPSAVPPNDKSERDRFRYRFRTGFYGKLLNDWSFGFRLETSTGNRSSNVTMGDDGGPFSKTSDAINIGQIYATWSPSPVYAITVGRMPNPLVTTPMVWDADINPEGFAEQLKYRTGNNEYFANLGQFLYSTGGTQNPFGVGSPSNDIYMFAWQLGYKRYIEGATTFFQIAPVLYTYAGLDKVNNPAAFSGVFSADKQAAVNDLLVVEVPAEYDWVTRGGVPARVFGEYAVNLDGDARARKFGTPTLTSEDTAWTLGAQYGKAANKGEWDVRALYQSVGAFALDPNLVDSDIFDSRTNMKGFIFGANYALGAATQLSLTYGSGERKNTALIAPGAGDIATPNTTTANTLHRFEILQLDLNIKY